MKNVVFWDVTTYVLLRTDVAEERIASIIRVTRINYIERELTVTNNRSTNSCSQLT
jgi:hypothetical protein